MLDGVQGKTVTKDEENADAFLASIFDSTTTFPQVPRALRWKNRDREQNEAPMKQEDRGRDLLHDLDIGSQAYGARWDLPKDTEGAGGSTH